MRSKGDSVQASWVLAAIALLAAGAVHAANGVWVGAVDGYWTNSQNWSASPYPAAGEAATFDGGGNGRTLIDVAGVPSVSTVTFGAESTAAYTVGAGGAKAQTLVLDKQSLIRVDPACGNSQVIDASLQLGAVNAATTNTIQNDSTAHALTLAGNLVFPPTGGTGYQKSIYLLGAGELRFTGNLLKEAFTCVVYANGGTQLVLAGSNHVNAVRCGGVQRLVIDGYVHLENSVYYPLLCTRDCEVAGTGTLRLSPVVTDQMAWVYLEQGRTLTVSMPIICSSGLNLREGNGTLVLKGLNDIASDIAISNACTLSVAVLGNRGSADSNLGRGDRIIFNGNGSKLVYTGSGETSDRIIEINNSAVIDHSGTGALVLSADLVVGGTAKTLTLQGSAGGVGELGGAIGAGAATTSLAKQGAGSWRLSGANTCAGSVAVNGGALTVTGAEGSLAAVSGISLSTNCTLTLENAAAANHSDRLNDAAPISLNGGTLGFLHGGGAANYSEKAGAVTVANGVNTVTASQADEWQTSALTLGGLSRTVGTIDFEGTGLGESDRNRIFIEGQPDGVIGAWATVNGARLAAYSSARGIYAAEDGDFTDIAARGPDSVIPDTGAFVRISLPGDAGPIRLEGEWTNSVQGVLQNTDIGAVVALRSGATNKTLQAEGLRIASDKASFTLGEAAGDGFLTARTPGGDVLLGNDSATSVLTVNSVVANNGGASTLTKSGGGQVSLSSAVLHTGATIINEGLLTFGASSTQSLAGAVLGVGGIAKSGTGVLRLGGNNSYAGQTLLQAGTLVVDSNGALGPNGAGTVISSNATLDVGGSMAVNTLRMGPETITVCGPGVDGKGAIINSAAVEQRTALYACKVSLSGDAAVGGQSRFGIWPDTKSPFLDLNGHTLSKVGANIFSLINVDTAPGAGNIDVQSGNFWLVYSTQLNGGPENTLTVRPDAILSLYMLFEPQQWTLALNNRSLVSAISGGASYNTWDGPVTLSGTAFLGGYNYPSYSMRFNGPVSGDGSVVKTDLATVYLGNTNNVYTGDTVVSNGALIVSHAGSLPGYATPGKVRVGPAGTLAVMTGDGAAGWSKAQLDSLRATAAFASASAAVGADTSLGDFTYDSDLTQAFSFAKYGANALALTGVNTLAGQLRVHGGELTLAGTGSNAVGSVVVTGPQLSTLNVNGPLTIVNFGGLTNGAASGDRCVMRVSTNLYLMAPGNSSATAGKFFIGAGSGATGAVYQTAGRVSVSSGLMYTDFVSIGSSGGYGYYRMTGGELVSGEIGVTGASIGNSVGVFDLYDGSVINDGAGFLVGWAQGIGVLNLFGGSLTVTKNLIHVTYTANRGTFGMINLLGPGASVNATATTPGSQTINMAYGEGNKASVVNLNNGTLRINKVWATSPGTPSFFNFNGGTLRPNAAQTAFLQGLSAATVYAGGAVIDSAGFNITVNQPLKAPTGYGVTGIALKSGGSGYIGAPAVQIAGGSGTNATAIAVVDLDEGSPTKGRVTGITVTSPGSGYLASDVLTVTLHGGGALAVATVGTVTKGLNVSGGLTKNGDGVLTLGGTNTYSGATVINKGTVKLANARALLADTRVTLAGGALDLNGFTVTNTLGGSAGVVSNGTMQVTLSPAGTGVIGSDTFSQGTATLRGRYLADVTADGACDLLTLLGPADLANLALEIVNPSLLNRNKVYTLADVTGSRTGAFIAPSLPDSRWHLVYRADGSVQLVFSDGSLLMLQ